MTPSDYPVSGCGPIHRSLGTTPGGVGSQGGSPSRGNTSAAVGALEGSFASLLATSAGSPGVTPTTQARALPTTTRSPYQRADHCSHKWVRSLGGLFEECMGRCGGWRSVALTGTSR